MPFGEQNKTPTKFLFSLLICFGIAMLSVSCQSLTGTLPETLESCQKILDKDEILEANKCYVKAVITHPRSKEKIDFAKEKALKKKCLQLWHEKQDFSNAAFCFESLALHVPTNPDVQYYLAASYLDLYKSRELKRSEYLTSAEKAISMAIQLDPKKAVYHGTYGRILEQKGEFETALEGYDYAIELDPNNYLFWISKALLQRKLGKHKESIKSYSRVLELKPDYELALYDIGTAYERTGEIDKAIEVLEKLEKLNGEYDDVAERLAALRETKKTGVKNPFQENMKTNASPRIKVIPQP